jgi:transcriptional regulator with GAF, ATPase, and Fis domain
VARVAAGTIPVLVVGETGVGKDVLASMVHALSPRRDKPMVSLNCAAIPENLLESELFGYERGAFTGAAQAKPGLLEMAEGGTVFLDEVGDMPIAIQAKLLRVLDQREVTRVGGLKPRRVDVRFVAATHRDLEAEVARGAFREDLLYRLNAVTIAVPPLRERVDEIGPLARLFATEASRALGRSETPHITDEALALLGGYAWPGNVRELRNVLERAVLLSVDGRVDREHLPLEKMGRTLSMRAPVRASRIVDEQPFADASSAVRATIPAGPRTSAGSDQDRARVVDALEQCDANQTSAAKLLGISRRTLVSRIELYGLPRPRKKS